MKLNKIIEGCDVQSLIGGTEADVTNISNDSRRIKEGGLFVAVTGFELDGHKFIPGAVANGAKAVVLEDPAAVLKGHADVAWILVRDSREELARIAANFYGHPTEKMTLAGVTGTNGKTSTVFLIQNILKHAGRKTGLIGTIENRIGDRVVATERTTPEADELQALFARMLSEGVDSVVMEVSSHALDLHRVDHCKFHVGVYTNLTLDHLDYHETMENYRDAKAKLFERCQAAVVNMDDPQGGFMLQKAAGKKKLTYGIGREDVDLSAKNLRERLDGVHFTLTHEGREWEAYMQTPGKFSVYNGLAAIGCTLALGIPMEIALQALATESRIRGRFEAFPSPTGYVAIVDYAHAPDGLQNVLQAIREMSEKRVITVFGCGGDRDKSKRPVMGRIAGEMSDYCIITSDNPRTESPERIITDVEVGMQKTGCAYERITDRKAAIHKALSMGEKGDVVLIAGKGHEDYQVLGKEKIHFDDAEVVLEFFKEVRK
ncbi:UDP-N-acetylmuramoyl-L-alanyl-D-glutamate--2,6-diaminopimelate ligase [Anaerotalea alkaliphila]|uniref:UDP-N-acetylmuramoyl-L-alanyl-D-glutamate--2,6-diaminopimelate ligase n=1 Tax=Anaerotalea alkaliphila TaxID=2662126 RepID=A0A7X5HT09_9FIRM|nr:UDP-N-acetylmuramoyl-L-alanyl-D-glutamate--2,6-diaminopimelate ligase [Anaerotalea alkaliphila]NDL66140.1 UDP-N-acetylmuramoyl-L-alanyl-D-glutamate--2,6-diaminopimelate ligase [Anaerotalea alkaliphila]